MVIRDLTLRSAASFGSFHLIRLLYDEYMFYLVEHKVASATGETPVAVMGKPAKKDIVQTALEDIVGGADCLHADPNDSDEHEAATAAMLASVVEVETIKCSPKIIPSL